MRKQARTTINWLGRFRSTSQLPKVPKTCVVKLLAPLLAFSLSAANVSLTWDPNPETDLAGYRIYWGGASRGYTNTIESTGNTNTVSGLTEGVGYFFAVTAYDTNGLESDYSNEVYLFAKDTETNAPPTVPLSLSNLVSAVTIDYSTNATGHITPTARLSVSPGSTVKAVMATASWQVTRTVKETNGVALIAGKATKPPFTVTLNVQSITIVPGMIGTWNK